MYASPWAVAGFFILFAFASIIGLTPTNTSTLTFLLLLYVPSWLFGYWLVDTLWLQPRWDKKQKEQEQNADVG